MAGTRITVRGNGPLLIEGDFEIVDVNGTPYGLAGRTRVTLCRCGQSATKPFCDSTHKECGFQSESVARDLPPPAPPAAAPGTPPATPATRETS